MTTGQRRLQLITMTAAVLRMNIEANGNVYDGLLAPNMQSISDLAMLPDSYLEEHPELLSELEEIGRKIEKTKKPHFAFAQ